MKFCEPHWAQLRQEVEARGLGKFIRAAGTFRFALTIDGRMSEDETQGFDPLIYAHACIAANAVRISGIEIAIMKDDDGSEPCPICILTECAHDASRDDVVDGLRSWPARAAEDAFQEATRRGLVASS